MIDLDLLCFVLLCFFRVLGKSSGKRFMTSLTLTKSAPSVWSEYELVYLMTGFIFERN